MYATPVPRDVVGLITHYRTTWHVPRKCSLYKYIIEKSRKSCLKPKILVITEKGNFFKKT